MHVHVHMYMYMVTEETNLHVKAVLRKGIYIYASGHSVLEKAFMHVVIVGWLYMYMYMYLLQIDSFVELIGSSPYM